MWDPRIVLGLVHRYGEACRRDEHAQAGLLYSEIVRALDGSAPAEDDELPVAAQVGALAGPPVDRP
jgi:hypothetical protein